MSRHVAREGASPLGVFLFVSLMSFGVSEQDPLLLLIHGILLLWACFI